MIDLKALRVRGYGNLESESFESYLDRWPKQLRQFPEDVIREWVWRHWGDFEVLWADRGLEHFQFKLCSYSNADILGIGRFDSWDDLAYRSLDPLDPLDFWVGRYMISHGTFPAPIIVATNSAGLIHPRGLPMPPSLLIEGHKRLGMLRGLLSLEYPSVQAKHQVWELTLPTERFL
ncbi:hypothetical protein [Stenotrophomonas sp. 22385]|uniref:hypothetical protein n=1 Tax=Stenotrophomonas sp. 22385 TaxID=3453915 RepID=UPI003F82C5D1